MIRDFGTILYGEEVVIILVYAAFFLELSIGYFLSLKFLRNFLNRSGIELKEVSLVLEMESDYDALKNFITSLDTFPAVLDIESLATKRNEKILPKVESRFHLKVMVL
jgi:hypothetical protein